MTPPPIPPEEFEQLAAEHALGVLAGNELAEASARFAGDAEFRSAVNSWRGRLAPLLEEVEPVAPPAGLWPRIEQLIGAPVTGGNVVQLRRRVTVWQGIAGASTALAAALALVLVSRPPPSVVPAPTSPPAATAPSLVAVLGGEEQPAAMFASWNPDSRSLTLAATDGAGAQPGRARELWVIPADGTPRSLGLIAERARSRISVAEALARQLRQGATLAVSVEPPGGSPTGLPTGPVIASGKLESA